MERPLPTLFTLFKGEFWVALHRDFCEYVHESPDNVARSLQVCQSDWFLLQTIGRSVGRAYVRSFSWYFGVGGIR